MIGRLDTAINRLVKESVTQAIKCTRDSLGESHSVAPDQLIGLYSWLSNGWMWNAFFEQNANPMGQRSTCGDHLYTTYMQLENEVVDEEIADEVGYATADQLSELYYASNQNMGRMIDEHSSKTIRRRN